MKLHVTRCHFHEIVLHKKNMYIKYNDKGHEKKLPSKILRSMPMAKNLVQTERK